MKVTDIVPGSPCWTQLGTSDPEAAQRFYGGLFGWTAETDPNPEAGGYTIFSLDGSPCAAVAPLMNPQQPVAWQISFAVPDVDEAAAAAQKAGARLWMGPMDVIGAGRWALLSDPPGRVRALAGGGFKGFAVVDEPGAFGWIDGSTRDVPGAVKFYQDTFGWEVWPSDGYSDGGTRRHDVRRPDEYGRDVPARDARALEPVLRVRGRGRDGGEGARARRRGSARPRTCRWRTGRGSPCCVTRRAGSSASSSPRR